MNLRSFFSVGSCRQFLQGITCFFLFCLPALSINAQSWEVVQMIDFEGPATGTLITQAGGGFYYYGNGATGASGDQCATNFTGFPGSHIYMQENLEAGVTYRLKVNAKAQYPQTLDFALVMPPSTINTYIDQNVPVQQVFSQTEAGVEITSSTFTVGISGNYKLPVIRTGMPSGWLRLDNYTLERETPTGFTLTEYGSTTPINAITMSPGEGKTLCLAPDMELETYSFVEVLLTTTATPHFEGFSETLEFDSESLAEDCFELIPSSNFTSQDYTLEFSLEGEIVATLNVSVESDETTCPSIAGDDIEICKGERMRIGTGCLPSPHPISGVEYCYSWQPEEGLTAEDGGPIGQDESMPYASPDETTLYTVYVTNSEGEFVGQDDVLVEVKSFSDLSVYPEMPSLCEGEEITLEAITWVSGDDFDYAWSTGATTSSIVVNQAGTYSVTVTDPTTLCTQTGSVDVVPANMTVTINTDVAEVCEGVTATLEAVLSNGGAVEDYTFHWSNGLSGASIEVENAATYEVTVTNSSTGCEAINDIEITEAASEVSISPENPIICPGGKVKLKVDGDYVSYLWSTGATTQEVEIEESDLSSDPVVSVTVTNADGCMATTSVEVSTDPTDPEAIRAYFEGKGFFAIDINIEEEVVLAPGEESRIASSLCETTVCESNSLGGCVRDDAKEKISINNEVISNLEVLVKSYLDYFETQYGYQKSRAYITKNEDICACSDYLNFICGKFEGEAPLTFWMHLFEGGDGGQDKLYLLTNTPTSEAHFPGNIVENSIHLSTSLQLATEDEWDGNTGSEANQIIFSALDGSLDNYTDVNPYNTPSGATEESGLADLPLCDGAYTQGMVAMSPAGVPMLIPDNFTTRFVKSSTFLSADSPEGALVGMTDFRDYSLNNIIRYYRGRMDLGPLLLGENPVFKGYHRVNSIVSSGDDTYGELYKSDYPFETNEWPFEPVTLGFPDPINSLTPTQVNFWEYNLTQDFVMPDYTNQNTGEGDVLISFIGGNDPILENGAPKPPVSVSVNASPIVSIDFTSTIFVPVLDGEGVIYEITHEDGSISYVLAVLTGANNIDFWQWNCLTGVYEQIELPLDEVQIEQIASSLTLVTEGEDPDSGEALDKPDCFLLSENLSEDVFPTSFNSANVSTSSTASIEDYIGMDQATKDIYQSIVTQASQAFGTYLKFIVTGDEELCPEGSCDVNFAQAQERFLNLALSTDDNDLYPDVIFRVHFRLDGRVGFCIRLAENMFTHTESQHPDIIAAGGQLPEEQAKEIKSLYLKKLRDLLVLTENPEQLLIDANGEEVTDEYAPRPMFFGKRPDNDMPINFFSVSGEIAGISKAFMKDMQLPENMWKTNLEGATPPLFETGEPIIAIANVIVEENPIVGAVQLATFGYSFANEVEVRQAILETIRHPLKAAQAFLTDKVSIYSGTGPNGVEGIYYEGGKDGMTLIIGVLSGSFITKIKNLPRKADPAARSLKEEIGGLKDHNDIDLDNLINDNFYKYFKVGNFTEVEIKDYFKFIDKNENFPNPADRRKLMTQPSLAVLWKKAKDGDIDYCPLSFTGGGPVDVRSVVSACDGVDLKSMIKKLPDPDTDAGAAFWQKYEKTFIERHLNNDGILDIAATDKVNKFMKDLQDKGDDFLDEFVDNPDKIKAWDRIITAAKNASPNPNPPNPGKVLRTDIPSLTALSKFDDALINSIGQQRFDNFLEKLIKANPKCSTCGNAGDALVGNLDNVLDDFHKVATERAVGPNGDFIQGFDDFMAEAGEQASKAKAAALTLKKMSHNWDELTEGVYTLSRFEGNIPDIETGHKLDLLFEKTNANGVTELKSVEMKNWSSAQTVPSNQGSQYYAYLSSGNKFEYYFSDGIKEAMKTKFQSIYTNSAKATELFNLNPIYFTSQNIPNATILNNLANQGVLIAHPTFMNFIK